MDIINMNEELEEDIASMWCLPDEHEMIDIGDEDRQAYLCKKCGYEASAYIVNNYMREPLY